MKSLPKILLIDDEIDQLHLLHTILSSEKYQLKECTSAEEALDLLEKEEVDLIIADLCLTGLSGTDFVCELRKWDNTTPVIFVSGYGKDADWSCAVQTHTSDLISKPYTKETILKAVHNALKKKNALGAI